MKCREVMELAVDPAKALQNPSVKEHVEQCKACRRQLESFRAIQRLMILKRYECRLRHREELCNESIFSRVRTLKISMRRAPVIMAPVAQGAALLSFAVIVIGIFFAVRVLMHEPQNGPDITPQADVSDADSGDVIDAVPVQDDGPLWDDPVDDSGVIGVVDRTNETLPQPQVNDHNSEPLVNPDQE